MKTVATVTLWIVAVCGALLGFRLLLLPFFVADQAVTIAEKTLSADNVVFNYELFHDLNQGVNQAEANIRAQDKALADLKATYGTDAAKWPKDVRERQAFMSETRQGYSTQYNRLAADYNANSRKLNRKLFKDKGLPYEIPLWSE